MRRNAGGGKGANETTFERETLAQSESFVSTTCQCPPTVHGLIFPYISLSGSFFLNRTSDVTILFSPTSPIHTIQSMNIGTPDTGVASLISRGPS